MLLTVLLLAGCESQEQGTALIVHVSALDETISQALALRVELSQQGTPAATGLITNKGQPIALPGSFVVQAEGRDGMAEITVEALDARDQPLGKGSGSVEIQPQQWIDASVALHPSDFQVNADFQYDQIFFSPNGPTAAAGRQLAAAPGGDFVVVWENGADANDRLDIYYRLFDAKGVPKLGSHGSSDERIANKDNEIYDSPSVSMLADGSFFVAWQRQPTQGGISRIFGRPFSANGQPLSDYEIELSGSDLDATLQASAPFVASLQGQGYVVVWQQVGDQTCSVMGRLLNVAGQPIASAHGEGSFPVASFACPAGALPPSPAVAGGGSGGFLVVWRDRGRIEGLLHGSNGAPLPTSLGEQIFTIDVSNSGAVKDPHVSATPSGYAVLWSDGPLADGPDSEGSAIRLRRYDLLGDPREAQEYTLNTTSSGDQRHPSLATSPGNKMLAVWTSRPVGASTDVGEIRGRRLLGNGMPAGEDFLVPSGGGALQRHPAVAARGDGSFIVVFEDTSAAGPDTVGSGIRGRLLFPGFEPAGPVIGATCTPGDTSCGSALSCQSTGMDFGYRCHTFCEAQSNVCSQGGQCQKLANDGAWICLYLE